MKTLLLIGTGQGSPDVVFRLKSLGLTIILVELKHMFDPQRAADADEIILTDYRKDSFIDFALGLRAIRHYDHVLSMTEFGVVVAARLNQRLGLRGSDLHSVQRLNDKAAMRAALDECGFSALKHRVLHHGDDVASFWAEAGGPLILKPVDGAGSHGIHLARSVDQAHEAFAVLTAQGLVVLAEEYVDGQEYSVESFSFAGRHQVIAITQKMVDDRFVEIGHVMPAMLDEATAGKIRLFVAEFLDIMGVSNGPCHTEMKVGSKGMRIIESHNRIGGGNIPRLIELTHGIDIIKLAGQWACDMVEPMVAPGLAHGAAAIHFFVFPPGEILQIDGLDALSQALDYRCLYRVGDSVPPMLSNSGRAGHVMVYEESPEKAINLARQLAHGIVATMDVPLPIPVFPT